MQCSLDWASVNMWHKNCKRNMVYFRGGKHMTSDPREVRACCAILHAGINNVSFVLPCQSPTVPCMHAAAMIENALVLQAERTWGEFLANATRTTLQWMNDQAVHSAGAWRAMRAIRIYGSEMLVAVAQCHKPRALVWHKWLSRR
jgi:hypothetical protein